MKNKTSLDKGQKILNPKKHLKPGKILKTRNQYNPKSGSSQEVHYQPI